MNVAKHFCVECNDNDQTDRYIQVLKKWSLLLKRYEEMKELRDKKLLTISEVTFHVMMNVHVKSRDSNGAARAEEYGFYMLRT